MFQSPIEDSFFSDSDEARLGSRGQSHLSEFQSPIEDSFFSDVVYGKIHGLGKLVSIPYRGFVLL